jgi:cytochrome c553
MKDTLKGIGLAAVLWISLACMGTYTNAFHSTPIDKTLIGDGQDAYNVIGCARCHGQFGKGTDNGPVVAGLSAEYVESTFRKYLFGDHNWMKFMSIQAIGFEPQIAKWLESLK